MVTMFSESANSSRYRYVATKLGEQLGVNVLIDAKPGGGGVIALRDVYRAQPMGYSLLLASTLMVWRTWRAAQGEERGHWLGFLLISAVPWASNLGYVVFDLAGRAGPMKALHDAMSFKKPGLKMPLVDRSGKGPAIDPDAE